MASVIENAARRLLALIERDKVCKTDLAIFADIIKECDEANRAKKNFCREAAKTKYQSADKIKIDDDAVVSLSGDDGAYVHGWLFINV